MKILIIGGTSSLGTALKNAFQESDEVITAGRKNCDISIDLRDPVEKIVFPNDIDVVIHTAAHFGGKEAAEIIECENINVVGTLKLCRAAVQANVKHFVLISSMSACVKQGSEYFGREVLYTAVTRVRKKLEIFGNDDVILKTIENRSDRLSGMEKRIM